MSELSITREIEAAARAEQARASAQMGPVLAQALRAVQRALIKRLERLAKPTVQTV